jgi:hypothetical protein
MSPRRRHRARARENASRDSQRQLNVDFLLGPLGRVGQSAQKRKCLAEIGDRFDVGGMRGRALPGVEPAADGRRVMARLLVVIGQDLGLIFRELWKVMLQDRGDVRMDLLPAAPEQGFVDRVAQQHVLEGETDEG